MAPIEGLVVNASPLICLFRANVAEILPGICPLILVPDAVWREVTESDHQDEAAIGLENARWAQRLQDYPIEPSIPAWDLGGGESSVVSYAYHHPEFRAVIDDAAARRCSRALGISTIGTGGLLVLAKHKGIISSLKETLSKLKQSGIWLSPELEVVLLKAANEFKT